MAPQTIQHTHIEGLEFALPGGGLGIPTGGSGGSKVTAFTHKMLQGVLGKVAMQHKGMLFMRLKIQGKHFRRNTFPTPKVHI